ncbi:MAG TPA: MFS transporter [Streptosporangiaceae bacterium]|jgi:MFS family permease|nr:MFS transporter [Streptosporangiaceae bacterium]
MTGTRIVTASGGLVSANRRGYLLTAAVLLATMVGGTLPIPLYVLYEQQMGFGPLGVTVVFAAYVVGTLAALVTFGDLSDHIGRRKVLAIAVGCAAVSTALFLVASGIGVLIAARIVSGLAAGFVTGTATAALAELQPRGDRQAAAVAASGSNMTGLGLGPLAAGIFAAYIAMPARSVFWAYLGVCALALVTIAVIPEPVRHPDKVVRVRLRLGVPSGMRAVMLGACLGVFAAFSVLGFFSSLVPTFLHGILGVRNLALIGAASFLIFITAAISQAVSAGLPSRRSVSAGLPLLLAALAALESALFARALWLFLAGTIIGGIAVGLVFRSGLSELNRLAQPRHRAAVVSTFFAAAYLGLGLPAVLTGLISQPAGTVDASAYTSALVAAIVLAAFAVVRRSYGTAPAPRPPARPATAGARRRNQPAQAWPKGKRSQGR